MSVLSVSIFLALFFMVSSVASENLAYVLDIPPQSSAAPKNPSSPTFEEPVNYMAEIEDGQTEKEGIYPVYEIEPSNVWDQAITNEIHDRFVETPALEERYYENNARQMEQLTNTQALTNDVKDTEDKTKVLSAQVATPLMTSHSFSQPEIDIPLCPGESHAQKSSEDDIPYDSPAEILAEEEEEEEVAAAAQEKPIDHFTEEPSERSKRSRRSITNFVIHIMTNVKKPDGEDYKILLNVTVENNIRETNRVFSQLVARHIQKFVINEVIEVFEIDVAEKSARRPNNPVRM